MTHYNFITKQISTLQEINYDNNHITHYNYNDTDFLFKKNDKKNRILTVLLHGYAPIGSYPIFRGYNYNLQDSDTLAIADKLQPKLNIEVTYYLHYIEDYINIIKAIYNSGGYDKILFFGSSSGAYMATFLASYFNQYVFISNGFLYDTNNHYIRMKKKCKSTSNKAVITMDIQATIEYFGFPKKVFLFSNKADSIHLKNSQKFKEKNKQYTEQIHKNFFHRKYKNGGDPHTLNIPSETTEYWIQFFINEILTLD